MTSHIFLRHWRMTSKVRKRTSRKTKKWKFNTNIFNTVGFFVVFMCRLIHEIKNPTNNELLEAVWHWYYMLFIYQTGYIMWHSRLRFYIPWGIHEIWRHTYYYVIEEWRQRYGKGHLEKRKNENLTQIYLIRLDSVFLKKPRQQ
jgi:hypothetical protein